MAKRDLFDSIDVPKPCPQSWDGMIGDDKSRFCANCEKDIHNLSAMTRGEVKKLLFQSKQSVCVRLEKDAAGKVKTLKKQFHQITRQLPIAAGVLSASLTFAAVADGQKKTSPHPPLGKVKITQVLDAQSTASISGRITDVQGAAIPNVQVVLLSAKNKRVKTTQSNSDGFYELRNIEASIYNLEAEIPIFKKFAKNNLELKADEKKEISFSLEIENESQVVGVLVFEEPLESVETKVSDKILPQQIESLPASNRQTIFLGLVAAEQIKATDGKNAQNLSRISFTIYDPQNKIVANETVELTNQKTRQEFIVLTDSSGNAEFSSIPQGRYDLLVSGNGFNDYRQIVQIKERIEPNIEITLDVSSNIVGDFIVDWSEIPLFRAIAQDDNETVKRQINSGFTVNAKDENGETALHVAVQHGNLEIVRFLLDKGAKVNIKDKSKRTPLAMIFDSFEDDEKINLEISRLLASKGANVNVRDEDGQTFLMRAAEDDNLESVKFLLKLGANPNVKDEDGETAFDKTDLEEIKRLLTTRGANH